LGPLLDANGWAVNTRATINIPFGSSLTEVASLPEGAEFSYDDPYSEERHNWRRCGVLLFVDIVALYLLFSGWFTGLFYHLTKFF